MIAVAWIIVIFSDVTELFSLSLNISEQIVRQPLEDNHSNISLNRPPVGMLPLHKNRSFHSSSVGPSRGKHEETYSDEVVSSSPQQTFNVVAVSPLFITLNAKKISKTQTNRTNTNFWNPLIDCAFSSRFLVERINVKSQNGRRAMARRDTGCDVLWVQAC